MPQDEQGAGDAATLAVWCADREAAAPVLRALETRFSLTQCETLPEAGRAAGEGRDVVLLYQPLAAILHRTAEDGLTPQAALPDWQGQIRALLDLHRQNRRRIRLVDLSAARAHPDALRRAFDLPAPPEDARAEDDSTPQDTLLGFLAHHYLLDDPEERALSQALEAASVVLAPLVSGRAASDAAFQAYRRQREESGILRQQSRAMQEELSALHRDHDALEAARDTARRAEERITQLQSRGDTLEETLAQTREDSAAKEAQAVLQIELLQAQTRAMQDELEAMAERNHALEAEVQTLTRGLENYRNRMADLRDHQDGLGRKLAAKEQGLNTAAQTIAALETHNRDQYQALTRRNRDLDHTRAGLDAARAEQAALQGALDQLLNSRSFRLTAPLRRVMALFSGGGRS